MRLLLLGCTGFIGSELVPILIQSGHELTIVSRKKSRENKFAKYKEKITFLNSNPSSTESWEKGDLGDAIKKVEGVINLTGEAIAEKRWSKQQCKEIKKSRLNTTSELIKAMSKLKKPIQVLVNGSAIGYYGTSSDMIFNESSPSGKDFLATLCERWEAIANKKPRNTRLVIIRTGIVLGQNGGALKKMLPVFRAGFGGPLGNGMQWMSWIHRTDLCRIIEYALTHQNCSGVLNGVSPNPVTMKLFCENLGKTLNRPNLLPVPGALIKLLLGDGAKVVLEGQKVISNRLSKYNFIFKYSELSHALLDITKS